MHLFFDDFDILIYKLYTRWSVIRSQNKQSDMRDSYSMIKYAHGNSWRKSRNISIVVMVVDTDTATMVAIDVLSGRCSVGDLDGKPCICSK